MKAIDIVPNEAIMYEAKETPDCRKGEVYELMQRKDGRRSWNLCIQLWK